MLTALVFIAAILVSVGLAFLTGWLMYRLAPVAGSTTEPQRRDWQAFGRNWGWSVLGILAVLAYFAVEAFSYRVRGRPVA